MRTEILMLGLAVVLGIAHLLLATMASTSIRGFKWNLSSRDVPAPTLSGKPARLDRSFKNFQETFPFFAAAILISLMNSNSMLSAIGSQLYLGARILYVPAYVFDLIGVRTALWCLSMIGIILVLASGLQLA